MGGMARGGQTGKGWPEGIEIWGIPVGMGGGGGKGLGDEDGGWEGCPDWPEQSEQAWETPRGARGGAAATAQPRPVRLAGCGERPS